MYIGKRHLLYEVRTHNIVIYAATLHHCIQPRISIRKLTSRTRFSHTICDINVVIYTALMQVYGGEISPTYKDDSKAEIYMLQLDDVDSSPYYRSTYEILD